MSFALSKFVDPEKVFLLQRGKLEKRLDPFFYIPSLVELEKRVLLKKPSRLRDFVLEIAGGATPARSEEDKHYSDAELGIPFLRVQNITEFGLDLSDVKHISRKTHEVDLSRSRVFENDLLVTITGRIASAAVAPAGFEGNINQHSVVIKTGSKEVSETLAAYLNLGFVRRLALRRATGGTRLALDYSALLSLPVIFDERIPELVRAANARREKQLSKADSMLKKVDEILLNELGIAPKTAPPNTVQQRIFHCAFSAVTGSRLDPLFYQSDIFHFLRAAECLLVPLGNCVTSFLTGFAAGRNDQADEENGVIQIRPTNLSNDRELVFRRNVYIARDELKKRVLDVVQRREVLFNNTNSQEQVGKTVFFDLPDDYFCSNHITRIATNTKQLDPQFLTYILNLYQRQQVFFKLCTNWNNQSGVGVDVLKKIPIPLPDDLEQQKQIVARLEKIRTDAHALRRQAAAELDAAKQEIEKMILGNTKK